MVQWPPSPIVEDEVTALAKEHDGRDMTKERNIDDQSVPSRGNVDQYPVIVDSDTNGTDTHIPVKEAKKPFKNPMPPKRGDQVRASAMFRHETGLPTPPPSDSETRGRPHEVDASKHKHEEPRLPRSESTTPIEQPRQVRPAMVRIQTDVAGELDRIKPAPRRSLSPYSYSREKGTFRVDHTSRQSTTNFLSPDHATASPVALQGPVSRQDKHAQPLDRDSSTDPERKSNNLLRSAENRQGPVKLQHPTEKTSSNPVPRLYEKNMQEAERLSTEMPARKKDRENTRVVDELVKDASRTAPRSRSRASRSASKVRESPYASSADESVRSDRYASTKKSRSGEQPVRRQSSHRRERPRLEEPLGRIVTQSKYGSSDDDATRRVYRVRDSRSPTTPPMVSTPHHMEDYFSKALQENALKPSRHIPRSVLDETTVISPPTSPLRTPRTEQSDRLDRLESPSSPQRVLQHSRGLSVEESYYRDVKAHSSLLSQATSTAAALASRTSPPISRAATNAVETTFACSNNSLASKSRSRASSPQRERIQRSDIFTYGEQAMSEAVHPPVLHSQQPDTRDGASHLELPKDTTRMPFVAQPQRNASWTGYEQQHRPQYAHLAGPLYTMAEMNTMLPKTTPYLVPPIYRSQSANTPQELARQPINLTLPPCPRSQPTQGLRDWCTIKGIPSLDICPKCSQAISTTRYCSLLARSLDNPYDKSITCSLSKPWLRVALLQSIKQNKSDLSFLKKADILPEGARSCEGSKPDVRMWWKLNDPAIDRAVPDFFVCSACVGVIHQIFPDLPDQFRRDVLNQEKVCGLHSGSKHFNTMVEQFDQIAERCRDRGKSSARYMQPFVDAVRRMTRHPECARDALLVNRAWHFMNDLPEFTICEGCYEEIVWPQRDEPVAKDISKVVKLVPHSAFKGSGVAPMVSSNGVSTHPVSCQLYSERMRRLFGDVVIGRISLDHFRSKVKERHAVQYRLTEINRMYEEDQRMGWDRRADIEKNRQYWRSLE